MPIPPPHLPRFICAACLELLHEPITLPCGYSVCKRCFARPSKSKSTGASAGAAATGDGSAVGPFTTDEEVEAAVALVAAYVCPARTCRRRHQYRAEKVDVLIRDLVQALFPVESEALRFVEIGEERLRRLRMQTHDGQGGEGLQAAAGASSYRHSVTGESELRLNPGGKGDMTEILGGYGSVGKGPMTEIIGRYAENEAMSEVTRAPSGVGAFTEIIQGYGGNEAISGIIESCFNRAIEIAPHLQLAFIVRSKALVELGQYDLARSDARRAAAINKKNRRGFVAERLVEIKRYNLPATGLTSSPDDFLDHVASPSSTVSDVDSDLFSTPLAPAPPRPAPQFPRETVECHLCRNTRYGPRT
ncbi:hypothetical protein HK104_010990, partial [Borealophlyctis nickersoniae]